MSSSEHASGRILIACIGNIFLGDDGFGVEVARRLLSRQERRYPEGVQVVDFGIQGMELAYTLLDDFDILILVDAVPRGGPPGTLYLIEPEPVAVSSGENVQIARVAPDAHSMDPMKVLAFAGMLGSRQIRTLLVGCEPVLPAADDDYAEMCVGLSEPVQAAIDEAISMIDTLVEDFIPTSIQGEK